MIVMIIVVHDDTNEKVTKYLAVTLYIYHLLPILDLVKSKTIV